MAAADNIFENIGVSFNFSNEFVQSFDPGF